MKRDEEENYVPLKTHWKHLEMQVTSVTLRMRGQLTKVTANVWEMHFCSIFAETYEVVE